MNKMDMLKVLTAVALLTLAPGSDAAPLVPGEPDVFKDQTDEDNKNPPDLWKTIMNEEEMTTRGILDKLLKTSSLTTFPDGDGMSERLLDLEVIKATKSPNIRGTGVSNPLKTFINRQEEISPASADPTEDNGLIDSEKRDDDSTSARGGSGARGELVKMLSALEEFNKLLNSTLSHRITIMPRGNGNGRIHGKKNKLVVTEGNLKSTTATTVVSGATSAKTSTDHTDPKLTGKGLKKSISSASKKPNKRVCFWKYCSQN